MLALRSVTRLRQGPSDTYRLVQRRVFAALISPVGFSLFLMFIYDKCNGAKLITLETQGGTTTNKLRGF
jgi:hypothetical protein